MILLSGHSLTHSRKVPLEALSLQLKERDSAATMTPADMTGIGINSWLRDDTNPGAGIVWRVKSISQAFATDTPTITLEHVINTLRDNILFGEITPATITGNPKATTCSAEQAVRFILARSSDWVLGSFSYGGVSNPYKFDGDSLYDALEIVSNSLNDAWWSYDMSVYPFRLNITAKTANTSSELRAGRNLTTITKTVDRSAMITRFYPIGKDDLHIPGDYVERNTNLYGVVSKVETDTTIEDVGELRRWAEERIKNHCEPDVTIDVEGFELADATGESLDRLTLGSYCRVPLPEFGTTITERIVTINYPDKIHQPTVFRVELANTRTDVTRIIADAIKGGTSGKGGRGAARQQKEDHAWFEDTDDHVAMVAESIIGEGDNLWYRLSQIVVDGDGIHQRVTKTEGDITTAFTEIDLNEERIKLEAWRASEAEGELSGRIIVEADRITQEVTRASEAEGELSGRIIVEADRITQEVTRASEAEGELSGRIIVEADRITQEVTRATEAEGTLDGKIVVEAGKITQIVSAVGADGQVTAASICLAINNGGSSATINADKIYLLGQTIANTITADYISSKIANIPLLTVQAIALSGGLSSASGDIRTGGTVGGASLYLGSQNMNEAIISASVSGNVLTLKNVKGDTTTFSKATSLSGVWSSGTLTVTASPQGEEFKRTLSAGARENADGTAYTTGYEWYVPINALYGGSGQYSESTGWRVYVDASAYVPPHAITAFDTTAPSGASYNNLTNNSDGYVISGDKAYIVTKSTWKCDGVNKEALSYLASAPTKLYAKGKTDGAAAADAAYTRWKTGSATLYYYDTESLSYKVATGSSKRWYYKS